MNRYLMIRRLTGPSILLLIGVLALLAQAGVIRFWPLFWPLLLILIGVLKLAERAALASVDYPQYPGAPYTGYGNAPQPGGPGAGNDLSIVPANYNRDQASDRDQSNQDQANGGGL